MEIKTFRNKRNHNKFIQVKRYKSGNFYAREFMYWETKFGPVTNYIGTKNGTFCRLGIKTLGPVLRDDYEEVTA